MRTSGWRIALVAIAATAPLAITFSQGGKANAAGIYDDCQYATAPSGDVATHEDCAKVIGSGALRLSPGQLKQMSFDADGLAAVQVGRLFFYVAADGRSAPVAGVEGHAVEFREGLAPSPWLVEGQYKIGYIDKRLRLVIPARFDGGLDFNDGRAQVCRGCKVARDGDWAEMQGGVWGCIDTTGREVIPVTQPDPDQLDCSGG